MTITIPRAFSTQDSGVLAMASSGIAYRLFDSRRTAYSFFTVPNLVHSQSTQNNDVTLLLFKKLLKTPLIIYNKIVLFCRHNLKKMDCTFCALIQLGFQFWWNSSLLSPKLSPKRSGCESRKLVTKNSYSFYEIISTRSVETSTYSPKYSFSRFAKLSKGHTGESSEIIVTTKHQRRKKSNKNYMVSLPVFFNISYHLLKILVFESYQISTRTFGMRLVLLNVVIKLLETNNY